MEVTAMASDLFLMVMEADGDLVEPFDGGTDTPPDQGVDTAPEQSAPPDGMDEPPPADDSSLDLGSFDDSPNGDTTQQDDQLDAGDDSSSDDQTNDDNANDTKLSDKANAVLNHKLYQQMIDRNSEIENILENLNKINPVLSYDIIKLNDTPVSRLRSTLEKCQDYMLNKFVDAKYGENIMFFQKVDALYTLLLQSIDTNLKQYEENN
jgi:hypothetical protein